MTTPLDCIGYRGLRSTPLLHKILHVREYYLTRNFRPGDVWSRVEGSLQHCQRYRQSISPFLLAPRITVFLLFLIGSVVATGGLWHGRCFVRRQAFLQATRADLTPRKRAKAHTPPRRRRPGDQPLNKSVWLIVGNRVPFRVPFQGPIRVL